MQSLILADSHFVLWAILVVVSAVCAFGERKGWFGSISGALVVILVMGVFASIGLVPSASDSTLEVPVYDFVFTYVVPIAIPLLLFSADLKKIVRESGRLLGIYLIGSLGVVLGAVVASFIFDLGAETHKVAGTFIGTYTGGSVNFMAVAATLDFLENPLFPATIAVDNVFTNIYIAFLFFLPAFSWLAKRFPDYQAELETVNVGQLVSDDTVGPTLMERLATVLAISSIICAVGLFLSPLISRSLGTEINLDLLVVTLLILILANVFPKWLQKMESEAYELGMLLLYVFLGVIGAASDIREMFTATPAILLFAMITLIVHFLVCLLGGKMLGMSLKEIAVASAANAGGPSTSAPMAATFGMKKAVTPAVLIGVLGYVIGTFLGVGTGLLLKS